MSDILVIGASGNVGRVVARYLAAAGRPVRLAIRPKNRDHLSEMDPPGVPFDFTDIRTWLGAFVGVQAMFLVRPPAMGHVRRDLLPALVAARDLGVRHVVFLSLQGADKNKLVPHATIEAWLRSSSMSFTFVRASFFSQNLSSTHAADIRNRDQIIVPAGTGTTAFVDTDDVGAVAAQALLDPGAHTNRSWTVTGPEALTYAQVADILTAELGRPIRYTQPGVAHYARHAHRSLGMPWGMVAITTAIYTTARLGLAAGLTDDVRQVLGRDPLSFSDFAHRERNAWIPPPISGGQPT